MKNLIENAIKLLPIIGNLPRGTNQILSADSDSPPIGKDPWAHEDAGLETSDKIISHFRSRKFAMTAFAVIVLAFMYFTSIIFLFIFQVDFKVTALVQMYRDIIVAVAAIVATLVTSQSIVDWRYHSRSNVETSYQKEHIIEESIGNEKEDDYTLDLSVNIEGSSKGG